MVSRKKTFSTAPRISLTPWLGLATIIILLDQVSKVTISRLMHLGESHPVMSFFNLVLAHNKGAAFSFLATQSGWQRYLFTGIAIGAAVFIMFLLKRNGSQRLFCLALALILGGAIGNAVDRTLYGYVIDFLDFHFAGWHFPAFNVADIAISIGAALFVLDELLRVNK